MIDPPICPLHDIPMIDHGLDPKEPDRLVFRCVARRCSIRQDIPAAATANLQLSRKPETNADES